MSEEKSVNLFLTFLRESEDGKECDEFSAVGTLKTEDTKTYIGYSRKTDEMTEDVVITIHTDGRAEIDRTGGGYKSRLFIRNGKTIPANYMTPFGAMDLSTKGISTSFLYDGEKGVLKLSYDLLFSGKQYSLNDVTIKINQRR